MVESIMLRFVILHFQADLTKKCTPLIDTPLPGFWCFLMVIKRRTTPILSTARHHYMQATNFQSDFRNIFTEMKLDILHHFETNSGCLVLNAKFCQKKTEAQKLRFSHYFDSHSPVPVKSLSQWA